MDVTLGLVLTMSSRKEWPRTCIAVQYPPGHSEQVVKHGQTDRGIQRYLGQNTACVQGRFFLAYRHRGCGPAVKPTSLALRRNASGLRDTARGLRSRTDTGWSDLKKKDAALALVNAARLRTIHPEEMTVAMARAGEAEMQERWSCVGHKGPPRGPWHAARPCHWLVCQPLCLWTGGVNMAISTFETLPGVSLDSPPVVAWFHRS